METGKSSSLFSVLEFYETIKREYLNRQDEIFNGQEYWGAEKAQEIASRCQVTEDECLPDEAFTDPQLVFLLKNYKNPRVNRQKADVVVPSFYTFGNEPQGTKLVVSKEKRGKGERDDGEQENYKILGGEKGVTNGCEISNGSRKATERSRTATENIKKSEESLEEQSQTQQQPQLLRPPKRKNVAGIIPVTMKITPFQRHLHDRKQQIAKVFKTETELDAKFKKVARMLDNLKLASLKDRNCIPIPTKYRPPINYVSSKAEENKQTTQMNGSSGSGSSNTGGVGGGLVLSVSLSKPSTPKVKMAEFLVLSSQKLTVLRDIFYCINDFLSYGGNGDENDNEIINYSDRKTSSSYFFIEETFYVDKRNEKAIDYSTLIIEKLNNSNSKDNNNNRKFGHKIMDETRFEELNIRINYPYLFCHQGNCQHIMYFTSVSYMDTNTNNNMNSIETFPRQTFNARTRYHKCQMCNLYVAKYITVNDFHSGETPCYFCDLCYIPFHYDKDGKLLLEHKVFPYASLIL